MNNDGFVVMVLAGILRYDFQLTDLRAAGVRDKIGIMILCRMIDHLSKEASQSDADAADCRTLALAIWVLVGSTSGLKPPAGSSVELMDQLT